ncbi:protein XcpP [Pseudomonas putida]|uniref:protein XcpP n=1 Tax=Pseudomonas putida TaxID=303 RepID=UPI003133497F
MKRTSHLIWLACVVATLAWLAWRERTYPVAAPPVVPAVPVETPQLPAKPLPAATVALAFGFQATRPQQSGQADVALKASFVSSQGEARALVKSHGGEAIYRVGDRIPGRGVLRRIDVRSIVLWSGGREEVVSMSAPAPTVFLPAGAAVRPHHTPAPSSRLLWEVQ